MYIGDQVLCGEWGKDHQHAAGKRIILRHRDLMIEPILLNSFCTTFKVAYALLIYYLPALNTKWDWNIATNQFLKGPVRRKISILNFFSFYSEICWKRTTAAMKPTNRTGWTYRMSKKTEFCQIEHLQILLVIGEKYFMIFVANPVVSCFESAISMLLLGALQIQPSGHRVNCYCWGNSSMVEGRFSKWF